MNTLGADRAQAHDLHLKEYPVVRPEGLWPFTVMLLDQIDLIGCPVLKVEAHSPENLDEPDQIWGDLTPHLGLSEGGYLQIYHEDFIFNAEFGGRGCSDNDPSRWNYYFLLPIVENAALLARAYCDHFTRLSKQ